MYPRRGRAWHQAKGKLIAFKDIPKQIERDEIDESYGFESSYYVSNKNGISIRTNTCFILSSNGAFYDQDIFDMFLNHPALEVIPNPILQ